MLHFYSIYYGKWDFCEPNIYLDIYIYVVRSKNVWICCSQVSISHVIRINTFQALPGTRGKRSREVLDWLTRPSSRLKDLRWWRLSSCVTQYIGWILGGRFWGEMLSFVLLCFHSKGIWFRNRVYLSKEIKYVLILIFHLIYILSYI